MNREGLEKLASIVADELENIGNAYELRDRAACEKVANRIVESCRSLDALLADIAALRGEVGK